MYIPGFFLLNFLQLAATLNSLIEIPPSSSKYEDDEKPSKMQLHYQRKYVVKSDYFAVPTVQVEALVGQTTKLPCQMNSTKSSDVFLVLWYVDLDGKPIYR